MIKLIKYKCSNSLQVVYIVFCLHFYLEMLQYIEKTPLAVRLANFAIDDKILLLSITIEKQIQNTHRVQSAKRIELNLLTLHMHYSCFTGLELTAS